MQIKSDTIHFRCESEFKHQIQDYDAHLGQLDYNGVPYIFYPYHLAEQMDDEISCTVALLHDVVEDTSITLDDL